MKSVRALSFLLFIIAVLMLGPIGFASADSGGSKAGEALATMTWSAEALMQTTGCTGVTLWLASGDKDWRGQ